MQLKLIFSFLLIILTFSFVHSNFDFFLPKIDPPININYYLGDVQPQNSSVQPWVPKTYKIDLDLPYEDRWRELVTDKKQEIRATVEYIFENYLHISPWKYQFIMNMISKLFKNYHNQEFVQEIEAISALTDVPFFDAFLLNFVYELGGVYSAVQPVSVSKACTSILAQNQSQNVFHGRNFDFGFQYYLANLSAIGEFYKDGQMVFKGIVVAGSIGIITGMKPNGFSISIDSRQTDHGFLTILYQMIFDKSAWNVQYLVRKTLEEETNFTAASQRLQQTQLDASVYFIVGGSNYNEGELIARNPGSCEDVYPLDDQSVWFAVQTNYDRDQPDPQDDYRRIPAEEKLTKIGYENISIETLYDTVMSQFPNNNANTIMTVMMSPQLNYFNCTMWK